ncbi:MAG TPA: c(7)-type cytochrome triheme domain-containing protein [Dongiaceae bacterium]|nr:c(7)-type cytochrome triheme domain-containing protein [Dongiaceae bacterium]
MTTIGLRTAATAAMSAIVMLAVALMPAVAAERTLRLPADQVIQGAGASPGKVTFSHDSHVDTKKPACTTCHPTQFSILKTTSARPASITHDGMDAGRYCGACHNGKAAFGLDQCALCHRE